MIALEKSQLRTFFRRQRNLRPRDGRESEQLERQWHLLRDTLGIASSPIAAFWPIAGEPDIRFILRSAAQVLLPVLRDEAGADLVGPAWAWAEASFESVERDPLAWHPAVGAVGPELLANVGAIVVPALAVDRSGTRLGQGGGWYDRALTYRRAGVPIVAVVDVEAFLPAGSLPRQSHDVPVDAVITPQAHWVL